MRCRFKKKQTQFSKFYCLSVALRELPGYTETVKTKQEGKKMEKSTFGKFLAQLRRERGWTQKDLAEELYVSDKAVSKWERGDSLT